MYEVAVLAIWLRAVLACLKAKGKRLKLKV